MQNAQIHLWYAASMLGPSLISHTPKLVMMRIAENGQLINYGLRDVPRPTSCRPARRLANNDVRTSLGDLEARPPGRSANITVLAAQSLFLAHGMTAAFYR